VPANTPKILVSMRYITNQPTTGSMGHDSWGSSKVGVISPNTILLYPDNADIHTLQVRTTVRLPHLWKAASALPSESADPQDASRLRYNAVSVSRFVDSPIMCGLHQQTFDLVELGRTASIPPHRLHVFADEASQCELPAEIIEKLKSMVTQTALLTGSHPFDQFDILLGVTNKLPENGLEHARSTFNVLSPTAVTSLDRLRGWNRLLIPHEYLHAWCGKYRRPAGMVATDFDTPADTELLWVYEGLTQYLGELVEARCGLMNREQFTHRLLVELRSATHQQGRQWRTLADTGAAAHILRGSSNGWPALRRSQDFYMEGMLFWLEADAILRTQTGGAKSLDDFCHEFFRSAEDSPRPNPFTRDDLIRSLNLQANYDWDGLIRRRVESFQAEFDPAVAELLGYRLELQRESQPIPADTFRHSAGVDTYDSLGASFSRDGVVLNLLLGSPADQARLMQEMKIIGIGNHTWSPQRLREALEQAQNGSPIEFKIVEGDEFRTIHLHYFDGPRALNLVRQTAAPDVLAEILKPREH
jgi:predicted metalloprotease with PDZ domain